MKKLPVLLIIIACMAAAHVVNAQTSDETAVAAAVETLRKAMLDGDKTALEKISAEKLTYGHSSGQIDNKEEFVTALATGKSDFARIDISDQKILITGNTAIVRHVLKGESMLNGNTSPVNLSVMLVWQKQGKDWKLLARQAVKIII
ncbi:MAG TPA: nuclear transport factor 2 family protein [Cyclobacteriaceae bacterium]